MVKPGIYKHFKTGNNYKVHFVAKHSETMEDMVVYEALYNNEKSKYWIRPLYMWEVNINGKSSSRFELIEENN